MPTGGESDKNRGESHDPKGNVGSGNVIPAPPPPPDTKTPVQFNQQINVYQIPPSAWDRLSPDQIANLSKDVLIQADIVDDRHYRFAMAQADRAATGKKWAMIVGGIITVVGFCVAGFLASSGNTIVAISIALPLATILGTVVGNRFLG